MGYNTTATNYVTPVLYFCDDGTLDQGFVRYGLQIEDIPWTCDGGVVRNSDDGCCIGYLMADGTFKYVGAPIGNMGMVDYTAFGPDGCYAP
jgi:hypothetical protein